MQHPAKNKRRKKKKKKKNINHIIRYESDSEK